MVRIDCFSLFVSNPNENVLFGDFYESIVVTSGEQERRENQRGLQDAPRVGRHPVFLDLNFGNRSVHLILSYLLFCGVCVLCFIFCNKSLKI